MAAPDVPKTQKQWVVKDAEHGFDGMVYEKNALVPPVGETGVLVKMHGAALNFRDLIIPRVSPFLSLIIR